MGIDTWFSWQRATVAYVGLSAVFLLSDAMGWMPGGRLMFAFAFFGPVAWLFWGVPLYVMATIAFGLSVLLAVFLQGRSVAVHATRYWLLPAVVWFALGAWALLANV